MCIRDRCKYKFDNDIMSMLRTISRDIHEQKSEIKEIKSNFNDKFNEQNNEKKLMREDVYKRQVRSLLKNFENINTNNQTFFKIFLFFLNFAVAASRFPIPLVC